MCCFHGADMTLKAWLAHGWNCLLHRVGAWLQTVGEKPGSGEFQESSEEPIPHPIQQQGARRHPLGSQRWPRTELGRGLFSPGPYF